MKNTYLLIVSLAFSFTAMAQLQVVGSAGTTTISGSGSISWTMGEVATASMEGADLRLTQGFQQGSNLVVTNLNDLESLESDIIAYPNPIINSLTIETKEQTGNIRYNLYTPTGQLLSDGTIESPFYTMDLSDYPTGNYIVRILKDSTVLKSFNVLKSE